jgi:hypothetical protein
MTQARLVPAEQSAVRQFVDAVLDFSEDPGPVNLVRYLAASRALEESQRAAQTAPQARTRSKGSRAVARRGKRPLETATGDA